MRTLSVLVFALIATPVFAEDLCNSATWSHLQQQTEKLALLGKQITKDPLSRATEIINPDIQHEIRGRMNFGVFTFSSSVFSSPLVLKISKPDHFHFQDIEDGLFEFYGDIGPGRTSQEVRNYVAVHQRVGELALAPKLVGLINYSDLKPMIESSNSGIQYLLNMAHFPLTEMASSRYFGVLMERLPAFQPLSRNAPRELIDHMMSSWCENQVTQALREIIEIRRRLILAGIYPHDQQLVVDFQAHVHLIDVDAYRFNPKRAPSINFDQEMEDLVVRWQETTGQIYNPALWEELLIEAHHPITACSTYVLAGEWRGEAACTNQKQQQKAEATQSDPSTDNQTANRFPRFIALAGHRGIEDAKGGILLNPRTKTIFNQFGISATAAYLAAKSVKLLFRMFTPSTLSSVILLGAEPASMIRVDLNALNISSEEFKVFISAPSRTQNNLCRKSQYQKLCKALNEVELNLSYALGEAT